MRSAAVLSTLLLLLTAAPLLAQERPVDFTVWGSWVDMQGSTDIDQDFSVDFESGSGFGISTDVFWTPRLSTELAVFSLQSDAQMHFLDVDTFDLGPADLVPILLGARFHFLGGSRFDPYVGAGLAYVMADDLESEDLDLLGIGALELDDEATWYANAGIGFHLSRSFALVLDGRYIAYEPEAVSSVTGVGEDLEFTPVVVSVGARLRF